MRGQFHFQDGYTYRMPVSIRNYPYSRDVRVFYDDCRVYSFDQRTDMEALAPMIPEEFEITAPIVNWQYANCRGVDFISNCSANEVSRPLHHASRRSETAC